MGAPPATRDKLIRASADQVEPSAESDASIRAGFVALDAQGRVRSATAAACALFGVENVDELRTNWALVEASSVLAAAMATQHAPAACDIMVAVNGASRGLHCELHRLEGDAGAVMRVDPIEHVAAFQTALYLANRHRNLSALHGTTVHDLRDMLNAMTLHLELLDCSLDPSGAVKGDPASVRRCITSLRRELQRLDRGVRPVLDLGRIAAAAAPAAFNLSALAEAVAALVRAPAQRQRVEISLDGVAAEIEVTGHREQIHEAVLSVTANALEAMPTGGRLRIEVSSVGAEALITISDSGPGLAASLGDAAWDLFRTMKPQRLGIGLPVARRLVEAHGGTLTHEPSDPGARFVIRLPRHS